MGYNEDLFFGIILYDIIILFAVMTIDCTALWVTKRGTSQSDDIRNLQFIDKP